MKRECPICANERLVIEPGEDFAHARRCVCFAPCPDCGDAGYVFERDERGYATATPCPACSPVDRRIRLFNQARLPARYASATLNSFEPGDSLPLRQIRASALRFANEFTPGLPGPLYYGECGTGKTHLMVGIARHLVVRRSVGVRFIEFMHLLSELRATFGDRGRAEDVMAPLVAVTVLAVDELGKGRDTEWERTVLDELITKRYNAGRTTIFTSNYYPGVVVEGRQSLRERVGERIYSRLQEMCVGQAIVGEDYRRKARG